MKKFLFILLLFPVFSGYSQNIDIRILREINLNRNTHLDGAFKTISSTASPFSIGTPIILYGIGYFEKDKAMKQKAIYIGATVVTAAITTRIMKYSINRPRPFETYPDIEKIASGGSPSFPSGHTSDAFALATSLTLAYPKWYVVVPSFAWAGAVGYSRMHLGVHYPSDVLMGAVTGAGTAYLCYKGQQWLRKRKKMIEYLNSIDTELFLFLNGMHNAFFDPIMFWMSHKLFWVPMYLLIVFLMIRQYKMRGVLMLLFIGLVITLCDQTASHLLKNLVQRIRPSHEPDLAGMVHLSKAGAGGLYGFVSSHAANCFGLASFIYFTFDKQFKPLKYWLFTWAVIVSYSRIYNGVHYPGDVLVAAFIGFGFGWLMAKAYFLTDAYLIKRGQNKQ